MPRFRPKRHFIENQKLEAFIAVVFLIAGLFLVYDAYKARGRDAPFPLGIVTPW